MQAEILRQDYERSSKAWRYERCGNTSCFQIEPNGAFGKIFGSAQRGLRLAGGKKGRPFAKRPDESLEKEAQYRMVGAYEKVTVIAVGVLVVDSSATVMLVDESVEGDAFVLCQCFLLVLSIALVDRFDSGPMSGSLPMTPAM